MKNGEKIPANDLSVGESTTVHQRFKVLIDALGLTRNKFAKELDMASTQIYSVINGRNAPSHKMYAAIVKAFPNVNINYLLVESGEPLQATEQEVIDGKKNMNKVKSFEKELAEVKRQLAEQSEISDEILANKFHQFLKTAVVGSHKVPKKKKVKRK
jgi:DNA-binding XRE family transcriptional regulator